MTTARTTSSPSLPLGSATAATVAYERKVALQQVNLAFGRGEFWFFLGGGGARKTTLVGEVRTLFWVSLTIALRTGVMAFVGAQAHDFPPGQVAPAFQGCLLVGEWIVRALQ